MTFALRRPQAVTLASRAPMIRNALCMASLFAFSLPATPAAAAVTAISAKINIHAEAHTPDGTNVAAPFTDCWGSNDCKVPKSSLSEMAAQWPATVNWLGTKKQAAVLNVPFIDATWGAGPFGTKVPTSGTILFSNKLEMLGGAKNPNAAKDLKNSGASSGSSWNYSVNFTSDTILNLQYSVTGADDNNIWSFDVTGDNILGGTKTLVSSENGFDTISVLFHAGDYTFGLNTSSETPDTKKKFFHELQGSLLFSFADAPTPAPSVPEPTSWALMLGGFGMIGGTMRASRRRTNIAYR